MMRRRHLPALSPLAALFWAAAAFAQDAGEAVTTSPLAERADTSPSMLGSLVQMLLVLAIVVGLVYLTLNFGLRRLMGIKAPGQAGAALVSVVNRVQLDAKRSLYVVKAGTEYLLVGAGEGSLSLLTKMDPVEVERVQAERAAAPVLSPFLQKLLSRRNGPPPPTA